LKYPTFFALVWHAPTDKVIWQYGNFNRKFRLNIVGFLNGLDKLGRELFGEGIASITLDRSSDTNGVHEVFCVNLEGQFIFLMTDPQVTIQLLEDVKIDTEIDLQLRAILSGQGAMLYSNFWSEDSNEDVIVDELFQDAVRVSGFQGDPSKLVGNGACSLAILTTTQLLKFHWHLRRIFRDKLEMLTKNHWALLAENSGIEILVDYKVPEDIQVLSGYLSVIVIFCKELFSVSPRSIIFGGESLLTLEIFCGDEYFLAAYMPNLLFQSKEFIENLLKINLLALESIKDPLTDYLTDKIALFYREDLYKLPTSDLFVLFGKFIQKP
jgi:hypothetical protein